MLRRIRFRWLMPLLMTAVQLVLFAVTAAQERGTGRRSAVSVPVVHAAMQEDEPLTFEPMASPRPSVAVIVAIVLNLPALLGGVVLAAILHRESVAAMLGFSALFVPLVWYTIGMWIDGQVAPACAKKKHLAGKIARWILRALSVLGLLTCLFGFHDDWEPSQSAFDFMPPALWCTWYLFCSFWGDRRLRRFRVEQEARADFHSAQIG